MVKKSLPKSLIKYSHMIIEYSDERYFGGGIWIFLKDEYKYHDDRTIIHEETIPLLRKELERIRKEKEIKNESSKEI